MNFIDEKIENQKFSFDSLSEFAVDTVKVTDTIKSGSLTYNTDVTMNGSLNATNFNCTKLKVFCDEDKINSIKDNEDNLDFLLNEFELLVKNKNGIDSIEFVLLSKILKLMNNKKFNHTNESFDDEKPRNPKKLKYFK